MKNKEIEELLNKLKNKAEHYILYDYEVKLLLSYIEQLEADCKEANDSITWWQNRYNAIERDNRELKKQKDDVVDYIKKQSKFIQGCDIYQPLNKDIILRMLGEIDEQDLQR